MNCRLALYFFFVLFLFSSCDELSRKISGGNDSESESKIDISKLHFDDELAYQYIEKQCSFGPRNPGSEGHKQCADWLLLELKKYCDTAYFQEFDAVTYDGKKYKGKNIIGKWKSKESNRILLSAHWDTRPIADKDIKDKEKPILGANDAGSGVGVLLALLHSLEKSPVQLGIDIVFFDIEDYGQPENSGMTPMENSWCLGSQFWAKEAKASAQRPRWGVLLDMVGGFQATFLKEEISALYASALQNRIWNNASTLGYSMTFLGEPCGQITDDHFYVNTIAGIPTVDLIHCKTGGGGFADYHHTHADNMSSVDKKTLQMVGMTLLYTIWEESKIGQ